MLDITAVLVFAGALFVAAASPGPGVAAIVARVLSRGPGGAVAFTAGLAVGDVVWLSVAVGGLAVLAQSLSAVFVAVRFAGAAYLMLLAIRIWRRPVEIGPSVAAPRRERPSRLFLAGLSLTLGNPKVIVFYLALLPNLVDLSRLGLIGYGELVTATASVLTLVFGAYVLLASRARRLFASPRAMRLLNRGSGAVMAGAAVAVATR